MVICLHDHNLSYWGRNALDMSECVKQTAQLHNFKAQIRCRVLRAPFFPNVVCCVPVFKHRVCLRLPLCVNACVHKTVCMGIWFWRCKKKSWKRKFAWRAFLFSERNPCGVQFVSSLCRRVEEEKWRGFGGTGIRKRQVAVHFTVD